MEIVARENLQLSIRSSRKRGVDFNSTIMAIGDFERLKEHQRITVAGKVQSISSKYARTEREERHNVFKAEIYVSRFYCLWLVITGKMSPTNMPCTVGEDCSSMV